MFSPQRRRALFAIALLPTLLPAIGSGAQHWPSRPIRIVVPYPAGGGPDISARKLAESLGRGLGVPVIVDNKPGASTLLGAQVVAGAAPDGYTVAYITSGLVTVAAMSKKIDLPKSLQPITKLNASAFVAVVPASSPYRSLPALMAAARQSPGKLSYGSAGIGSPAHMAVEHLRLSSPGLVFLHVPYKGAVESVNALRGGQIDFSVLVLSTALPLIKVGTLRALAVTTPARVPQIADVPTFSEAGVQQYGFASWGGFAAPAGTPGPIVQQLFAAIHKAARDPGFVSLQASLGSTTEFSTSPEAFGKELQATLAEEEALVKRIGQGGDPDGH
ncbi:extra-cytoplasmic solute receptor family protein 77 [Cupriavidus basilensis OR16]|uniref:Extra-cytoplasmic solute receptor family protein 77 n=1 Tax=Cupriavidus basilensis OR16 TaxID=1127483 RepID=H1S5T5_9BURK|nr:tripartite tricarboxylate transporter substrate binding protein [Cupriavidus basilensis]EHP42167.1 extra-cytoplasmic solute receptor family protein 77 [Cupriavidus basilensis OR16]